MRPGVRICRRRRGTYVTRIAYKSYNLPLLYRLPLAYLHNAAMSVSCANAVAVVNKDGLVSIAQDPANIEARSVYAFMALQKEDFKTALQRWREMLPLMEKGSTRYTMVERSMEYARQQLGQRGIAVTTPSAEGQAQAEVLAVKEGEFPLHITLAPGIKMPEDAHLFVFAVIPNGPPMPIAVKRIPGPQLPLTLSLGDGDAMMEGSKLAAYPELQFKARLSRGGNVMNKEGAFEGVSVTVPTTSIPTAPIDIRIDHAL
mgnify:CR=1 FL=1